MRNESSEIFKKLDMKESSLALQMLDIINDIIDDQLLLWNGCPKNDGKPYLQPGYCLIFFPNQPFNTSQTEKAG